MLTVHFRKSHLTAECIGRNIERILLVLLSKPGSSLSSGEAFPCNKSGDSQL